MTAWQDPPLTRREARERERLRSEQTQADAPTPAPRRATTMSITQAGDIPFVVPSPTVPDATEARSEPPADPQSADSPVSAVELQAAQRLEPEVRPEDPEKVETAGAPSADGMTRRQRRAMLRQQAPAESTAADRVLPDALGRHDAPGPHDAPHLPGAPEQQERPAPEPEHPGAPEADGFDRLISRGAVSSGSSTTSNALILPSVPARGDATAPFNSTGEILLTGSIDVPHGFSSVSRHPSRFESSDIDRLFDESEADPDTGNVAPIRASKAISTHTSTRGAIAPQRSRWGALTTVLMITAVVLALGVAGLLIAGYVLGIF